MVSNPSCRVFFRNPLQDWSLSTVSRRHLSVNPVWEKYRAKPRSSSAIAIEEGLTHRFKLMPTRQAMTQPFAQKQIELDFFIWLVHVGVGVGIDAAKAPSMFAPMTSAMRASW